MTPEGKRYATYFGAAAVIGGGLYLAWPYITGVLGSQPVTFPTNAQQAPQALLQCDILWWEEWQKQGFVTNSDGTPKQDALMQSLQTEADQIRTQFPGTGPAGGYTCSQLRQIGALPSSFPCPAGT